MVTMTPSSPVDGSSVNMSPPRWRIVEPVTNDPDRGVILLVLASPGAGILPVPFILLGTQGACEGNTHDGASLSRARSSQYILA